MKRAGVTIRACRARLQGKLWALLVLCSGLFAASSAHAVGVVMEISEEDPSFLESKLVRRLVTLELLDIQLPNPKSAHAKAASDHVYFRVVRQDPNVVLELWYHGELTGQRRLARSSGAQVLARRIALSAGELTRRLRDFRVANLRRERKRAGKAARTAQQQSGIPIYALPTLTSSLIAANSGGKWWWLGPSVSAGLRAPSGVELSLFGSLLMARTEPGSGTALESFEVGLRPGYVGKLSDSTRLGVSLNAVAMSLHSSGVNFATGADVFAARVGAQAELRYRVTRSTELVGGLQAGAYLRNVRLAPSEALPDVGRGFVGLSLGVSLTPAGIW